MLPIKKYCFLIVLIFLALTGTAQLKVGDAAPEISLPNTMDSIVTLASLKGKIVLVDFWASWCYPCRESNPGLVKIYKKYKNKGFEILGISLDVKKALWVKAIKNDKLTYLQVNDTAGWYSKTAEQYFVSEIPTSFLLNTNGIIIAINAEGAALEKVLNKILK